MASNLHSIAQVVLDVPLPQLFEYLLPDAGEPVVGRVCRVPFGSKEKTGIIVGTAEGRIQQQGKLRSIHGLMEGVPPLPADWLALCSFCADYYHHPLGQVMALALPPMLRRGKRPRITKPKEPGLAASAALPLLPEQQQAVDRLVAENRFAPYLLHGITGSGKTEVYLQTMAAVLARGQQCLMLVPEIALTPQLEDRVRRRFPEAHLVVAHSGMTDAARARGFLDALEGRAQIILGTRLAVFMPLERLGLIVVDEEHDASFKQQEGLRYSARDVAVVRAQRTGIPIVLGSATPSLETYHHAATGRYQRLTLSRRAVAENPPRVHTIDTRREKLRDGLSQQMLEALSARLARGEQSLIFLNRRGYAPVLACPACGWISHCRRCAANLVVHMADHRLHCHHCGLEAPIPKACPDCGNLDLQAFGRGTQRLEASLAEALPGARILRIDRDSASTPLKWQALLAAIHRGDADVLVGTQMLAKGHDFPKLTLVGVVGADAALFAADFRAPERLFAQLMQVGGRSGRADLPGEVLIQTEYPDHPLYHALAEHDYDGFAQQQIEERRQAGFPPFAYQALLRAEADAMDRSLAFLKAARAAAGEDNGPVTLWDPVPMRLARLKNLERAQLLVESPSRPALQAFLGRWLPLLYAGDGALAAKRDLRWHLDVDPVEF